MGSFLKHIACNKCGSSDANALYQDGGSYCWSCGHYSRGNISPYLIKKEDNPKSLALPDDAGYDYPEHVLNWVFKYDLTVEELIRNNVYYSKERDQLIYSWWSEIDDNGHDECLLWQARNFSPSAKQKCYTRGTPDEVLPFYIRSSPELGSSFNGLVIVEDPISALKVLRASKASMPVLGSDLSTSKIKRVASVLGPFLGLSKVVVWLDGNMFHKAQRIADRFRLLSVEACAVYTEADPKECSDEVIKKKLDSF